jgi:hypothetical protein
MPEPRDLWRPHLEWAVLRREQEVIVGGEQRELVPNAELGQQGVDGANLYTGPATDVSNLCGSNVVLAIWLKHRKRFKGLDDLGACRGPGKALEEFLQDEPGSDDKLVSEKRLLQSLHLSNCGVAIPSKAKRPDARVDEQAHFLLLSAL